MIYYILIIGSWLSLLLIGIYGLLRRMSFIRIFIALEFISSASLATAVIFGISYSFFILIGLVESILIGIFLAVGFYVLRVYQVEDLEELNELRG
ncbi:MAG: hypothetical protein B6U76_09770 [Desulfurococcales archaeon ex4484_217_2]|nr:MAG: hypothetical protein B6U76_09770 [Desulfurococcales archaeon ex4484_217_2]